VFRKSIRNIRVDFLPNGFLFPEKFSIDIGRDIGYDRGSHTEDWIVKFGRGLGLLDQEA
jgi:hypothetical protein